MKKSSFAFQKSERDCAFVGQSLGDSRRAKERPRRMGFWGRGQTSRVDSVRLDRDEFRFVADFGCGSIVGLMTLEGAVPVTEVCVLTR